jgi:transposase
MPKVPFSGSSCTTATMSAVWASCFQDSLLAKLYHHYARARVIHVILDNYRIPTGLQAAWALGQAGGRIQLHFLPPYCPQGNKIERVWQDLHANVTRNHTCPDMPSLMREVRYYLHKRNRWVVRDDLNEAA